MAELVPDMVLVVDRAGMVRYVNRAPEGVTRDAVTGRSVLAHATRDSWAELGAAVEAIFGGGVSRVRVQRSLHPDGTERWYELHSGPLKVGAEVVAAIIVARDVTEARRLKAALAESEARFRTLFEHAPEAIVVLDVDRQRFVDANQNACALFGLRLDELTRRDPVELSPARQPDGRTSAAVARGHIEAALGGGIPSFEWVHCTGQGRDVVCEVRLVRLPFAGRRLVRGSIVDVTERLRLEERVREGRTMEAVGRMAAGVAHDFNNMLTIVAGSASMILQSGACAEELRPELRSILRATEHGSALTGQLLTFARRESPPVELLDINRVVGALEGLLRRVLGERILLSTRLDPDGAPVWLNRSQLEQLVMNLVVNARNAMGEGIGSVTIRTCRHLWSTALSVEDTGAGMTEEVRERIFEPFFTTRRDGVGTGLGLATVYAVVTNAGASIHVDSTPGMGSVFEIVFPVARLPADLAEAGE